MRNITALLFVATVPDSGPERLLREQKRVAESITNTARSPSEKSVRDVTHQLLRDLCPRLRDDRKRQDGRAFGSTGAARSEEHTSELQSQSNLVCRLLLEKKKTYTTINACASTSS